MPAENTRPSSDNLSGSSLSFFVRNSMYLQASSGYRHAISRLLIVLKQSQARLRLLQENKRLDRVLSRGKMLLDSQQFGKDLMLYMTVFNRFMAWAATSVLPLRHFTIRSIYILQFGLLKKFPGKNQNILDRPRRVFSTTFWLLSIRVFIKMSRALFNISSMVA